MNFEFAKFAKFANSNPIHYFLSFPEELFFVGCGSFNNFPLKFILSNSILFNMVTILWSL